MSDSDECTCYPGGFTPDTYEGPMRDCPVHGEENHSDATAAESSNPVSMADYLEAFHLAILGIQRTADLMANGLRRACRAIQDGYRLDYAPPRAWCEDSAVAVSSQSLSVPKMPLGDLGGSKVGERGRRPGPTGSAPGQRGCNQALTEAVQRAWNRTFGDQALVKIQDIDFFPHLTGSHWVPLGPEPGAGNRGVGSLTGSRPYRGTQSGTHSPGVGGLIQKHQDHRDPVTEAHDD